MRIKELVSESGVRLIAGLRWPILNASMGVDAALRSRAKDEGVGLAVKVVSAKPVTLQRRGKEVLVHQVAVGLLPLGADQKLPKGSHSLAACFAKWAINHPVAALVLSLPTGEYAVVTVLNGLPGTDHIYKDAAAATAAVSSQMRAHPTLSVFADDAAMFPTTILDHGLIESIAAAAGPDTLIRPLPINIPRLLFWSIIAVGLLSSYHYHRQISAEEARTEQREKARLADPVPKYLSALEARKNELGASRSSLVNAYRSALRIPVRVDGWSLSKVECLYPGQCSSTYTRSTGTYHQLRTEIDFMKLDKGESMNLNEARMVWQQAMPPASIEPPDRLMTLTEFISGESGSQLQTWMVAGLSVQMQKPSLWPEVPDVSPNFRHAAALAVGQFEVGSIQLPILEEVLSKSPPNVIWKGFTLDFGDQTSSALEKAKATAKGIYYVVQH